MTKRYTQPQTNPQIDWGNPLTQGLSFVSVGDDATNILTGKKGTIVGTVTKVVGSKGKALKTATGGANRIDYTHSLDTGGSAYTFGSVFNQVYPAALQYLMMRELAGVNGGTYTILMAIASGAGVPQVQVSFGTGGYYVGSTTISNNIWHVASASTPPNGDTAYLNSSIWLDGIKQTNSNGAAGGTVGRSTQTNMHLNGRPSDNARQLNGAQALSVEWRRTLSEAEHSSFNANPWQIFKSNSLSMPLLKATLTLPSIAQATSDTTVGGWTSTAATLSLAINEPTRSDAEYISVLGISESEVLLNNVAYPFPGNTVIKFSGSSSTGSTLRISLVQHGSVLLYKDFLLTSTVLDYSAILTSGELATFDSSAISARFKLI